MFADTTNEAGRLGQRGEGDVDDHLEGSRLGPGHAAP
jgi:hypothetical protein